MRCYYCCDRITTPGWRVEWRSHFFHPTCFLKWVSRVIGNLFNDKNAPFDDTNLM